MGYDATHRPPAAASAPAPEAPAAGKRTRTQALPATGHALVDKGLYCDRPEAAGDPGCSLDRQQGRDVLQMIGTAAVEVQIHYLSAFQAVRAELLMKHMSSWGIGKELALLAFAAAVTGPLSALIATGIARTAMPLAQAGAHRAAWAAASVDPEKVVRPLGTAQRGIRAELAHGGGGAPKDKVQFLEFLELATSTFATDLLQSIAAEDLNHQEMLALYDGLTDQSVVGKAAIKARIETLLAQFGENRLGVVGNRMFGTREVAIPVRVKLRKREYMVLCESFGINHPALALTGAHLDDQQPKMTMDTLTFVRIAERFFHGPLETQWRERREDPIPFIDFDDASQRSAHRWFGDFYAELMHHPKPLELAAHEEDPS